MNGRRTGPAGLGALCALVASCAETDPLPSPAAPRDDSVLVSSSSALEGDGEPVAVAGLPGAVEEEGTIHLTHKRGAATIAEKTLDLAPDGAFAGMVTARAGDELLLILRTLDGRSSAALRRTVKRPADANTDGRAAAPTIAGPAESDASNFASASGPRFTVRPPDAAGAVLVEGADLAAGIEAVIAVPARASTARALVDADGKFSARVRADVGDAVLVFTRDPATGDTSPVSSQKAPAP